ncbi:ATP-grasp ribosomal peptide maturase [Nocardiopsis sp. LSu2-4]|uniref:ATP-grasp ribosomal peptide maturase n=1 Tax=Nocardiopsis suaedae TaxID=3018444 RepID=A0ABT4TSG2_9ACTN|nr:ATP-grasp ribosomal peptide maturase [Nocardiopsis suaedae]MDA2807625.1 ATP-grasp ribosomal peptide maturase [Nocardiopsis suaedae]
MDIEAVYYRQPRPFEPARGLSEAEARFASAEARFGLGGVLASLDARWVPGAPGRVADAEYKPLQLAIAARCGLSVPPTMVTNDPAAAREFAAGQRDGAVYKALMHKLIADSGEPRLIYTSPVAAEEIGGGVAATAHQFQADLAGKKAVDARLLVTLRGCAAVAIRAERPEARRDFRLDYAALDYAPIEVPAPVAEGCTRYLSALGLTAGVFGFCLTDRDWLFLECGPGAQWGWLQEATGVAMSDLVAEELMASP